MPVEEAMQEIEFNSGTQFDPVVVEAFKRALKVQILKKYLKNIR
jgi:HD-GYP domain-containing protein (c-di-GMP phosphodiesterase class II)